VKVGKGWYDHEFALTREGLKQQGHRDHHVAWNWISVQLDNGIEITAYDIFNGDANGQPCASWAIVVDPCGNRRQCRAFTFEPLESWTSARTFIDYPISWRLEIPEIELSLDVKAAFEKQEFITIISEPSFWEGRVHIYGEPLAINAGCAAYFLVEILIQESKLTDQEKLQVYSLYFEALRVAHAGQGADLSGLDALMPQVVESGDGQLLEQRVLAIHRLKSPAPVRALTMLGATIGGGTPHQINAIGHFFEMIGLAFQIVDDVLNLRGFKNDLKSKGEDISAGKVTIPIAKAMSRLPLRERRELWETLSSKPADPAVIAAVIAQQPKACNERSATSARIGRSLP
jgi:hypothetical protein